MNWECLQTKFIMTIIIVFIILINVNFVLMTSIFHGQDASPPPGYRNYSKILQDMHKLVEIFPNLARVESITPFGKRTYLGNEIFALRITKDVKQEHDRPNVLMVATHHAREIINAELLMRVASRLLNFYKNDSIVTDVVDNNQIYVIPVLNVDGYIHVFERDRFWRKNLFNSYGVDINRNYELGFDSACGGPPRNTSDDEYRGVSPLSEAESFTLTRFSQAKRFAKAIDFHSRGRVVYCGYSRCLQIYKPINDYIRQNGAALAQFASYRSPLQATAAGKHEQMHYQYTTWYSFLVETYEGDNWQPSFDIALKEIERVQPLAMAFLRSRIPVIGHVFDAATKRPIEAKIIILEGFQYLNGETRSSEPIFGRFQEFLPDGKYLFEFIANGYQRKLIDILVVNGDTLQVEVPMIKMD